ncbi:hypothetical protein GE09DRAFT_1086075 [Coniochaeta sp. 2T2.1]|nr:hypothetical protein GE09DRAFT_1086075 [Coniochaeta sp. 2T2.1]
MSEKVWVSNLSWGSILFFFVFLFGMFLPVPSAPPRVTRVRAPSGSFFGGLFLAFGEVLRFPASVLLRRNMMCHSPSFELGAQEPCLVGQGESSRFHLHFTTLETPTVP